MYQAVYELRIPKARVGSLIAKKGKDKTILEKHTNTSIKVSAEGEVEITGEGLGGYLCGEIVKAIGRGFNPQVALQLLEDNYGLEIIDLKSYAGNNKKKLTRIKSRIIGIKGKAWKVIERLTECDMSVYGNTVSLLGNHEKLYIAFRGVEKLLMGSPHGNVYGFLEREMKKLRTHHTQKN